MLLVLCHEADPQTLWALGALRARGLSPMLLTGEDLAHVKRWRHSVGAAAADFELVLADDRRLRRRDIGGVLNRLSSVPWAWLRGVGGPDREYALQEMHAFYLSWLHCLSGPVLNPPTPQGLCGNWRHPSAWAALAARAGLPIQPFGQTSDDDPETHWRQPPPAGTVTVHVAGAHVVGPAELTRPFGDACLGLSRAAGAPLLGVDFAPAPEGGWRMIRASILPDLACGGEPLADALAEELSR